MTRPNLIILLMLAAAVAFAGLTAISVPAQDKAKDALVGNWFCADEGTRVQIRENGTLTINGAEYAYKVKSSVITVTGEEGAAAMPFSLDGDTLTVEFQGREFVYTRVKGDFKKGGGSPADGEGIIPQFVGKWCYMSNLTGSNSYMSSRCFTLYANGTYEYSAESSSGGAYGSTASQSYDAGRWTATRTTLTAISNTRGKTVYPIVLRNHPKNNDPMIVVAGDAYVTATQKRPW